MEGFLGLFGSSNSVLELQRQRLAYANMRWNQVFVVGVSILFFIGMYRVFEYITPYLLKGFYDHRNRRISVLIEDSLRTTAQGASRLDASSALEERGSILTHHARIARKSMSMDSEELLKRQEVQSAILHLYCIKNIYAFVSIIAGLRFNLYDNHKLDLTSPIEAFPLIYQIYASITLGYTLVELSLISRYKEAFGVTEYIRCILRKYAAIFNPYLLLTSAYPGIESILYHVQWIVSKSGKSYYSIKYYIAYFNATIFTIYTIYMLYAWQSGICEGFNQEKSCKGDNYVRIWIFLWLFVCRFNFLKESWNITSNLYRENIALKASRDKKRR